jgi:hypothetical protein
MQYIQPQIVNVLKADSAIQIMAKAAPFPESDTTLTTSSSGVRSDE